MNRSDRQGQKAGVRPAAAYLLWLFLGTFGAHRFYVGKRYSALLMAFVAPMILSFGLFFYLLPGLGVSPLLVISPFLIWWGVDAIMIPRWLSQVKKEQ